MGVALWWLCLGAYVFQTFFGNFELLFCDCGRSIKLAEGAVQLEGFGLGRSWA